MNAPDPSRRFRLRVKSALASLYFATMFFVVGPALVLSWARDDPFVTGGPVSVLIGAGIIVAANLLVAQLVAAFIRDGDGTHVPIDPPRHFVRALAYRHARNPMYLCYVATVIGEAILFRSAALVVYAAALWLIAHLYVVFREEPLLERRFGADYRSYCARVSRWGWTASSDTAVDELAGADAGRSETETPAVLSTPQKASE